MNYLQLIPMLIEIIKAIELAMPQSPGKDKFEAVILAVEGVVGSVQTALPQITPVINALVKSFAIVGLFTKKAP